MANGTGTVAEPQWQDYKPDEQGWQDYVPPKQGAVARFRGGLRESMGFPAETSGPMEDLSTIGSGLKTMATHPAMSANLLRESMDREEQSLIDKAYTEQHSPDLMTKAKGFVRGMYASVPFLGPAMNRMGEQFESGDWAGGAGTGLGTAGMLTDDIAASGGGAALGRGVKAARQTAADVVRAAPETAGAMGGYAVGAGMQHPYIGAYVGSRAGAALRRPVESLARAIEGDRGPMGTASSRIGGPWVPSSVDEAAAAGKTQSQGTRTLRGDMRLPHEGTTSSIAGGQTGEMPKEQAPIVKETTKYPLRNKRQQAAAAQREAAGRTSFSAGPRDTPPAPEARPVPLGETTGKSSGLKAEMGGESETDYITRRPPGKNPAIRSLERKVKRREAKGED